MLKYKLFTGWMDDNEETWLREQSNKGWRCDGVRFPGFFSFSHDNECRYAYHLSAPASGPDGEKKLTELFTGLGWQPIGRNRGWVYFRRELDGAETALPEHAKELKASRYQRVMMGLVGLLPFLLIIFPAIGRRLPAPLYEPGRALYFILLLAYTLKTFLIYRRVNQLRDN